MKCKTRGFTNIRQRRMKKKPLEAELEDMKKNAKKQLEELLDKLQKIGGELTINNQDFLILPVTQKFGVVEDIINKLSDHSKSALKSAVKDTLEEIGEFSVGVSHKTFGYMIPREKAKEIIRRRMLEEK